MMGTNIRLFIRPINAFYCMFNLFRNKWNHKNCSKKKVVPSIYRTHLFNYISPGSFLTSAEVKYFLPPLLNFNKFSFSKYRIKSLSDFIFFAIVINLMPTLNQFSAFRFDMFYKQDKN